jgi:hypothetical protein
VSRPPTSSAILVKQKFRGKQYTKSNKLRKRGKRIAVVGDSTPEQYPIRKEHRARGESRRRHNGELRGNDVPASGSSCPPGQDP